MVSVPLSDTNSFLDLICLSIQMVRLVIVLGGRVHKRKKKSEKEDQELLVS